MLQAPKDFNLAIPKQTTPAKQTMTKTPSKTPVKTTTKTPTKAPTPTIVIKEVPLPSSFDASGVLRIRKVNGSDIVEKLVKTKTGSYIGIPYYGLGDFITFNAAPSQTGATSTGSSSNTTSQGIYPTTSIGGGLGGITYIPIPTGSSISSTSQLAEGSNLYFTNSRARVTLSGTGPIDYSSTTGVIGFITGTDGQVLAMSGSEIVWKNPDATSTGSIDSVFGRTGSVIAQAGDYTTDLVTEGSNLYFTDARAQNALSGSLLVFSSNLVSLSGTVDAINTNLANLSTSFATLSGIVSVL